MPASVSDSKEDVDTNPCYPGELWSNYVERERYTNCLANIEEPIRVEVLVPDRVVNVDREHNDDDEQEDEVALLI